jgi:hypothetical protein
VAVTVPAEPTGKAALATAIPPPSRSAVPATVAVALSPQRVFFVVALAMILSSLSGKKVFVLN